jgi:hypothetical protein
VTAKIRLVLRKSASPSDYDKPTVEPHLREIGHALALAAIVSASLE